MLRNYLKIALRNIARGKTYAFINILGLAVGFTCVLLIVSFVNGELSYDQFHSKKDLVYRVVNNHTDDDTGHTTNAAYTYAPLAGLLTENIQGVERVLRIYEKQGLLWVEGKDKFIEKNFLYADSTFFDLFDFDVLQGDIRNALTTPFSVVITKSIATKYFGNENPVGRVIHNQDDNGTHQLNVTAVIDDLPSNTHLAAGLICSMVTLQKTQPWNFYWYYPEMYTYLEFQVPPNVSAIEKQMTEFVQGQVPEGFGIVDYRLQKLDEIYLTSQREGEFRPTGNYKVVVMFIIIAAFILAIAAINFMNLATARSIKKAREVGVRKVMGAYKKQLIGQFLTESVLTTVMAFILSLALLFLVTGLFENVINKDLSFRFLLDQQTILVTIVVLTAVGLLAGIYPAVYLSSFDAIQVLRQQQGKGRGPHLTRKILVVAQFTISCLLILGTAVIYQQMTFMRNKKLGFNKEQIIVIPLEETKDQKSHKLLKERIKIHSSVADVAMTSGIPGETDGFYGFGYNIGTDTEIISIETLGTDEDFVRTFGVSINSGRDFSEDIATDKDQSFLINQAMAEFAGWKEPLGQKLTLNYYIESPIAKQGQVIGVVEDFHFQSLYHSIEPLVIHILPPSYYSQFLSVRVHANQLVESTTFLKEEWQKFNADRPFEYFFLDDNLNKNYQAEMQLSKTFTWFAVLAIFISCLGLVGLAAFTTEQRTKEIGIRKVMGASIFSILRMISREYIVLIALANLLAWPVAWNYLSQWLNDFAYRITLQWWVFIVTAVFVAVIALLSVAFLAAKAAKADPVRSLRYE